MKNSFKIKIIIQVCLVVISFLLGGLVMFLIMRLQPINNKTNEAIIRDDTVVYEKNSLAKAVDKVYDAVVAIESYENGGLSNTGTGFVYRVDDKYGYVMTNQHVISGATEIKVTMSNEEKTTALVLGSDKYLDLAVIRIDKKYVSLVANIGSSEKMNLGDTIFAVGSPLGIEYRGSVTSGILSGKERMVSTTVSKKETYDWVMRVLQTDAPLNPGNSGGPLLNAKGEVIGVCTMKLVDDKIEGMGFAIPIEYAMSHSKTLENGVKIKWPELGIGMKDLTDINISANNIKLDNKDQKGIIISNVKRGSCAEKSGLQIKDIITKINDKNIKNTAYLRYELYQHQSGDTVTISYIRDGKEHNVKVKLD